MSWTWSPPALAELERFLATACEMSGPLTWRRIGEGHSNLTFLLSNGERQVVFRRPPPPPLPKGANNVLREAKIMRALEGAPAPTPRVLAESHGQGALDFPFYVMTYVAGDVFTTDLGGRCARIGDRKALADAYIDALAQLHAVNWQERGLEGFGRPEGFNLRHLDRIGTLLDGRQGAAPALFADVRAWLVQNAPPESDACIVHNDYRLGNLMWTQDAPPSLAAILDWELATIGDPLLDVGYVAACYPVHGSELTPTQELSGAFLAEGFPTREQLLARYESVSGRSLSHLDWYAAMANWKLAVLYDYSRQRGADAYYSDPSQSDRFLRAACIWARL